MLCWHSPEAAVSVAVALKSPCVFSQFKMLEVSDSQML